MNHASSAWPPWQIVQDTDDSSAVTAFGGLEIAHWDLRGKIWNQPLYQLLGGAVRKEIPFTEYFVYRVKQNGVGGEMDCWHHHYMVNGPVDHFHNPENPGRFRRLPLN